jgi:hypothetical protein
VDTLGAITLVLLAQELTQTDRNSLYQIFGLIVTGAFGALAAFLGSKSGSKADKVAEAIKQNSSQERAGVKVGAGLPSAPASGAPEPGNGYAMTQSWRDLASEWRDRYQEEAEAHDQAKATVQALRAELRRLRQQQRQQPGDS